MRREKWIADQPLTPEDLATRLKPTPGNLCRTLVRRRGDERFTKLHDEDSVAAGDEIVFYDVDPSRDEDLSAANGLFNSDFYVASEQGPWPDEERVIREFIPVSGASVLEICCGAGRLAATLVRDGNRVTALDSSAACIEHARGQGAAGVEYLTGDALALPFADRSFDVACVFENSLGVLFSKKTRALDELLRVARSQVIVGLREQGDDAAALHVYHSPEGYIEIAQTFTLLSTTALVDGVAPELRARIAHRRYRPGDERPWGGNEFFVVLELT